MTTIIGIQHEWGAQIFADGQTTGEDGRPYNHEDMRKVVKRGEYLIATAGGGAACDVVAQAWLPPVFKGKDPYREMVVSIVPNLRKFLRLTLNYEMDGKDGHDLTVLIAVHGHLFLIEDDGTVMLHPQGVYGIGTGSAYAVGALYAGADIRMAMTIANMNDVYTGTPFVQEEQVKPGKERPNDGEPSAGSEPVSGAGEQ